MNENVHVVARETIPPIHDVEEGGALRGLGELRDFRWNDQLRDFMPSAEELSISWVELADGETLAPHRHPTQSMMVFYGGTGQMLGERQGPVGEGDVVVVPAGREHGFTGGEGGLQALSIQFGRGLYTNPAEPRVHFSNEDDSLESLLAYNEQRLAEFVTRPIFDLLAGNLLDDPRRRKVFMDTLQIWVDGNQTLLFSRQATTRDPAYEATFLRHMREEMGHEVLHRARSDGSGEEARARDPLMEAITNWFAYQMYVLDNAEKTAVIHLVIERASAAYHRRARPALAKYVNDEYFEVHVDADDGHAAMGERLLEREDPRRYAGLRLVVGEAWDMIGAMTDRVTELTRAVE
jgi:mannose-6-phosphate isomerase-like protein (cupin superfamily)